MLYYTTTISLTLAGTIPVESRDRFGAARPTIKAMHVGLKRVDEVEVSFPFTFSHRWEQSLGLKHHSFSVDLNRGVSGHFLRALKRIHSYGKRKFL